MQDQNNSIEVFPRNLVIALELKGWTQNQLADASGVLQGNISNYVTGRREPKAAPLLAIANALGVTMEWLLTGEGETSQAVSLGTSARRPISPATKKALRAAQAALDTLKSELEGGG